MATTTADKGFSEASIWGCGKCETFTTHSVPEMKLHYLHAHGLNFLVDMRKVWLAEHPVLAAAKRYKAGGLAPIYLIGKKPVELTWTQFPFPTDDDLITWFKSGRHNIGIRTGTISNGLVVVDLDGKGKQIWDEKMSEFTPALVDKIQHTRKSYTSNGIHDWLRVALKDFPNGIPSTKLWAGEAGTKNEILFQADGKQIVVWPSIHPETGKTYQTETDKPIEAITYEEYLEILKAFGKSPKDYSHTVSKNLIVPENDEDYTTNDLNLTELEAMFQPFYHEGNRHDLSFAIANIFRCWGVPEELTSELLIQRLGRDDSRDKIQNHANAIAEAYGKPKDAKFASFAFLANATDEKTARKLKRLLLKAAFAWTEKQQELRYEEMHKPIRFDAQKGGFTRA